MAPSLFFKITVSSASKTFLPLDLSLTSLMFEPSAIWIFHPFLFLFVQQRQKTNPRSPLTSPGTLLATSSPRGQQSHLFHLRYPPWSLKAEDHLVFLILHFPPFDAWTNEFENSCDLPSNIQYRSWILLLNWSPYLLNDWKILVLLLFILILFIPVHY